MQNNVVVVKSAIQPYHRRLLQVAVFAHHVEHRLGGDELEHAVRGVAVQVAFERAKA